MSLTTEQKNRYARHLALDAFGESAQNRLLRAHVLLVGAGGLGSPIALYLAAAGLGRISIVDADFVDASNLQRQILFTTADIGKPKVQVAAQRLEALNPDVVVTPYQTWFTATNASELMTDCDFVIDATDNFESKFLIADTCHHLNIAYSHAGVNAYFGQTFTVIPRQTTCYRCLFNAPPPPCNDAPRGPIGVVPGVIGSLQANETIKYLTKTGTLLTNRLLTFDALSASSRIIPIQPNPNCRLGCGDIAT